MSSVVSIERKIGAVLLAGTLISTVIVLIGGVLYLLQHGTDLIHLQLLQRLPEPRTASEIWQSALSFTPLGMVELGLLLLIGTQLLRVLLLFLFYLKIRDFWFSVFCGVVLLVLIYSFYK